MDRRVPRASFRPEDRRPGPVPQGPSPDEAPPSGGPASSGTPPTGHPTDSLDAPPPPPAEAEESAGHESVPEDSPVAEAEEAIAEAEQVVLEDLAKLSAERDDYLEQLRRTKADFENYRKRVLRQQSEHAERAAEALVEQLLPVLDTFELAVAHGQGFEQVQGTLLATLEKDGLERIDPMGKPFDPTEADAVAHEVGDGEAVVAEVLRPGYRWKGRVIRPAMVRVRG